MTTRTDRIAHRTPAQAVALVAGIVFLLVGLMGFIPGITSPYDLKFAGHSSGAMLLGAFQVSVLHNIVHLLYGVVGLGAARTPGASRHYLIWGGAVYLLLWIYGLLVGHESAGNFVPLNTADNWLHFFLGAIMLVLGLALGRQRQAHPRPATGRP